MSEEEPKDLCVERLVREVDIFVREDALIYIMMIPELGVNFCIALGCRKYVFEGLYFQHIPVRSLCFETIIWREHLRRC